MGAPPAKELLPDPISGQPLIEYSLEIAKDCGASPLIISREDKTALTEYFANREEELLRILASREWADSLLQSEKHWLETNLVLLPDTRFDPPDAALRLFRLLEQGAKSAFAIFSAPSFETWGVLAEDSSGAWSICEKPRSVPMGWDGNAWGFFGFRAEYGREILEACLRSGEQNTWMPLSHAPFLIELKCFIDLTRAA